MTGEARARAARERAMIDLITILNIIVFAVSQGSRSEDKTVAVGRIWGI
jgi:hypothetical protein